MKKELALVILAAGKGTRMRSKLTKVLHPLAGIPLAAHPVHAGQALDPEKIVVVIGHQAEATKAALENRFGEGNLQYAIQEEQLGTAHALMCAREEAEHGTKQLLLLSGDVPLLTGETLTLLSQLHNEKNAAVSMLTFETDDPTGYGRIVRDDDGNVLRIREHRDCSEEELAITECNAGIYLFDSEFLFGRIDSIDSANDQAEFYLTDIVEIASKEKRPVIAHIVEDPIEVMGVNDKIQLAFLENAWQEKRRKELMASGVTLRSPQTVTLDFDVTVGQDTVIEPYCCLFGKTKVGEDCIIGAGSYLRDVEIPSKAQIIPNTQIIKGS